MQSDELKCRISAGRGDALADLVLRNARIVNVFTDEIDTADIAISGNCIVGVGAYHGRKEVDLRGKYVCPGLIDGHIHVESSIKVEQVYKNGTLVAEHGKTLKPAPLDIDRVRFSHVMDSFDLDEITLEDLELRESGEQERVICLNRGELLTEEKIIPFQRHPGKAPGVDPEHNIVKLAVFERHHHSGHVGIGFLGNFSLKCGAVASSIAHDSHNLIVAGDNDTDMMLAGNTVRKNKGGLAFVAGGQVVAELALPVAGLMSTESAESVAAKMQALNDALKAHGVAEDIGIFMTLAFVSLPVIPKLRLNTYGVIDVTQQKIVPAVF